MIKNGARKTENRRRRRDYFELDVKVRSQHRVQEQVRHAVEWLAIFLVLGLVAFGGYRAFTAVVANSFTQNSSYNIAMIKVESDGSLSRDEILNVAGVKEGQNLFMIDLSAVRLALEGQSMIRRAEVRRVLPSQLSIHVWERVPIAQLYTKATMDSTKRYLVPPMSYLIDGYGVVMKSVDPLTSPTVRGRAGRRLPLLEGVDIKQIRPGNPIGSDQVEKGLTLVHLCENGDIVPLLDYDRIDVSSTGFLVMTTRQGGQIIFATEDLAGQMKRLKVILTHAVKIKQIVRTCDLSVKANVPVTFFTNTSVTNAPGSSAVAYTVTAGQPSIPRRIQ